MSAEWVGLARAQEGVLARRQLRALGVDADRVRNQLRAGRWQELSATVVCATTGPLSPRQRLWFAALHPGGDALVGGLSALTTHGLRHWERETITVLVGDGVVLDPVPGLRFLRSRRALRDLRAPSDLPLARVEPAALLWAAYEGSTRSAQGLLAATVQQRLTTPARLSVQLETMRPLRRAPLLRRFVGELEGGAQSLAEVDLTRMCRRHGLPAPAHQRLRRDSAGVRRFTDCEWLLRDGSVLVLEIDGGFHMEVEHWEDDLARQRRISAPGRLVVRCTAREVREDPERLAADLRALGLGSSPPRVVRDAR